jgi:hypothetical protein
MLKMLMRAVSYNLEVKNDINFGQVGDAIKFFGTPTLAGLLVGGMVGAPMVGALIGLSLPIGIMGSVIYSERKKK